MLTKLFFIFLLCPLYSQAHTLNYFQGTPLKIIKIGHPTLRKVAKEVNFTDINTDKFQNFIDNMIATMKKAGGVGLAAPQVNVSKRIFVMKGGGIPLTVVINPKVQYLDQYGMKSSTEGCLSIPGKRVRVQRYKRIHMDYLNREGDFISEEATGFKAVVAQHEYDHLNGVLIGDLFQLGSELVDFEDYVSVPQM